VMALETMLRALAQPSARRAGLARVGWLNVLHRDAAGFCLWLLA
jgi:hypothetical protein